MKKILFAITFILAACAISKQSTMPGDMRAPASTDQQEKERFVIDKMAVRVSAPNGKALSTEYYWTGSEYEYWDRLAQKWTTLPISEVRKSLNDFCPGDQAVHFHLTEGYSSWNVVVTFYQQTHQPTEAHLTYHFRDPHVSATLMGYDFISFPQVGPPNEGYRAVVKFSSFPGLWDSVNIVTESGRSMNYSREDILRPTPPALDNVVSVMGNYRVGELINQCLQAGLL